jgi:mono/diheme cytochrome c family protein
MRRGLSVVVAFWLLAISATVGRPQVSAQQPAATPATPAASHRAMLDKYCVTCHNQRTKTAGLLLDTANLDNVPAGAEVWEKVIRKVRGGMMPPVGMPRPEPAALEALVTHLETTIDRATMAAPTLRTPIMHRLTRVEYANAVRDILNLEIDGASLLPADEEAFGFDNIADVQGVSPALMDRYLSAAWRISSLAVGSPKILPALETYRVRSDTSQHDHIEGLPVGTRGGILIEHYFPVDGEYVLAPRLYRNTVDTIRGLERPTTLEITVDGARVHLAKFGGLVDERESYDRPRAAGDELEQRFRIRMPFKAGPHTISVAFVKYNSAPTIELLQPFGRERVDPITPVGIVELDRVTLEGPFNVTAPGNSPSRQRIFTCRPASEREAPGCATRILTTLARRAYRGSVTAEEQKRLVGFYEKERAKGGDFDAGIEAALTYMLVSPQFLFRIERDPAALRAQAAYRIDDLELASRLSFFLWSTVPDDELLALAARNQLRQPAVLERQVKRMLADERARTLGTNFAGQWLFLRNIRGLVPDPDIFPDFDNNLRQAMQRETELLFENIILEDRSALDLLTADYTFLNERLAKHYGVANIYGTQFRRVPVATAARRGLLGHASILTLSSYPNRTSPVTRGKYVLTNILGTPPPPPPPDVPPFNETPQKGMSMRDRMATHRKSPACAACHQVMDPIGLSLENFDGIGKWRTSDNGAAIDSTAVLWNGAKVDGPAALRQAIVSRPEPFIRNMTEMLFMYGLGRGIEHYDMPFIRSILRESSGSNYRFSSLVLGIVKSAPFQMRRSES